MKDRVKQIRKDAGLTMEQFGEKIGMKKASVSLIESGRNNPSDSAIKMICREFHVNEEWLRTGEGEMRTALSKKEKIAEFFADVLEDDNSFRTSIVELLAELTVEDWEYLADLAKRIKKQD